jgi:hypothetical protein
MAVFNVSVNQFAITLYNIKKYIISILKKRVSMKNLIKSLFVAVAIVSITASPALAARPTDRGGSKPSDGGGTSTSTVGYDVSYPQCGTTLPDNPAFAIVGINGGNAVKTNPCLKDQLAWGSQASGLPNQPALQLYINTANPGEVIELVTTWPTNNLDLNGETPTNKYGNTCSGANDLSCSWLYGWNRALDAAENRFTPAAQAAGISDLTSDYVWWLDVETMNTWQSGSEAALRRNVATLEGMKSYFETQTAKVGLYSTAYQWGVITGNFIGTDSNLNGLPNWRPSGASLKNAKNNCRVAPLTTGGKISLTQYVIKNLDHNYSCNN